MTWHWLERHNEALEAHLVPEQIVVLPLVPAHVEDTVDGVPLEEATQVKDERLGLEPPERRNLIAEGSRKADDPSSHCSAKQTRYTHNLKPTPSACRDPLQFAAVFETCQ